MEIKWTFAALEMYDNTLEYWSNHNKSNDYSQKIMREVALAEIEIIADYTFLTDFFTDIKLYRKRVFNGKFYLFFDVMEEENIIRIKYFRSSYQKPLSKYI